MKLLLDLVSLRGVCVSLTLPSRCPQSNTLVVQVVNHTSNLAAPFLESAAAAPGSTSEEGSKRDWYIWKKGSVNENGERVPPNNWGAAFGGVSTLHSPPDRHSADLISCLGLRQSVWEVSSRPYQSLWHPD